MVQAATAKGITTASDSPKTARRTTTVAGTATASPRRRSPAKMGSRSCWIAGWPDLGEGNHDRERQPEDREEDDDRRRHCDRLASAEVAREDGIEVVLDRGLARSRRRESRPRATARRPRGGRRPSQALRPPRLGGGRPRRWDRGRAGSRAGPISAKGITTASDSPKTARRTTTVAGTATASPRRRSPAKMGSRSCWIAGWPDLGEGNHDRERQPEDREEDDDRRRHCDRLASAEVAREDGIEVVLDRGLA